MQTSLQQLRRALNAVLLILLLCLVGIMKSFAQIEGLLNGTFSINEQVQVGFSKGNLQYQASTNTWRFAEEQTDYIGAANSSISSTNSGWIDLFGWGTSGFNHGAVCYQPWSTNQNNANYYAYGNGTNNLFNQTGQADWGYNAISNGGNQTGQWRTLTMENWYYLLYTRSTPSGIRYTYATIDSVKGLILFPDDWNNSIYTFSSSYWDFDTWFEANTITLSDWKDVIEPAGAVFLPAASYRTGTTYYDYEYGNYWTSSTSSNGAEYAASMGFESWFDPFMFYPWDYYGSNKSNGLSVRLAKTVQSTSYTITTEVDPVDGGTVTGEGDYEYGQYCTLTASPNDGYSFCSWKEDGAIVSLEPSYGFTVTENRNLVADFNECGQKCNVIFNLNDSYGDGWNDASLIINFDGTPYRTLTLDYSNGYSGTFSVPMITGAHVSLEWVSGGYDYECSFTVNYESGIPIFQMSSPSAGLLYEFDCNCGELFNITTVSNPLGGGGTLTGAGYYGSGEVCTLTAVANDVHVFENWTKDGVVVSDNPTYSFTVTGDATYVANFTWTNPFSVDYVSDGLIMYVDGIYNKRSGHASTTNTWEDLMGNYDLAVSSYSSYTWEDNHFFSVGNGGYLNTGQAWKYFHSFNNDLTIEIVAYIDCDRTSPSYRGLAGWHEWSDGTNFQNDQGSGRMQTLGGMPVTEADDMIATVSYTKYNGSFLNGIWKKETNGVPNGANSDRTVVFGNSHTSGRSWNDSIYCIRMYNRSLTPEEVAYNHTIDVERFHAGTHFGMFNISVISNPTNGGTVSGAGTFEMGESCTLTAVPNHGYIFENWTNEGNIVSDSTIYSFPVIEDATFVANFTELPVLDTIIFAEICYGEDYDENCFEIYWPSVGINEYSTTLQSVMGYDSIVNLSLTVYPAYSYVEDTTLCNASSFTWRGHTYTESGIYYDSLQTVHGCDSIYQLSLDLFNTPLGEFSYMTPTNNYPFTSLPISFSWDAVSGAEYYNLYLWNANESVPSVPVSSHIINRSYYVTSLQNHQSYNWYVEAVNTCFSTTTSVRNFFLDIPPIMNVSHNNLNFGEVALNNSNTLNLHVSGNALDDTITMQITGEDSSMFSFEQGSNWNDYIGGLLSVTFSPTTVKYNYTANLVITTGTLTQTVQLTGSLADMFVFNTYVTQDVFQTNSIVPIYGTVMDANNNPAASAEVEVKVTVMNTTRSLFATTGADGHFSVDFMPAYSESGYYTINSGRVGHNSTAVHDDFNIPGMNLVTNGWILWNVLQNETVTGNIVIRNRSQIPLNNIQVTAGTLPDGCSLSFQSLSLDGMEEGILEYSVNGIIPNNDYEEIHLVATSDEGASMDFSVWYHCAEPRGILYASPNTISTTMTKGINKTVDVMLYNNGTGPTGNVYLDIPSVDWLSVVGNDTLPSIAVHDSAYFSLRLSANQNTPLAQHTGNIAINCERGDGVLLPYSILAVSDSTGTLVVDVTDDYTYNGNGQHLAGAAVTVKGYYSLETVATGLTNSDGLFTVNDLPEGYYRMSITAPRHADYQSTIQIEGGQTNTQNIYLQYQAISYSWNVVPTEIQDEYTFELIVEFETNVPVPVVVIDMPQDIPELEPGESWTFNYVVSNQGLVDAYEATLYPPTDHPLYDFTPLITEIDTIHAQSTVVIPCIMTARTRQRSQAVMEVLGTNRDREESGCPYSVLTKTKQYYMCGGRKNWFWANVWRNIGSVPCNAAPGGVGAGGGAPSIGGSGGGGGGSSSSSTHPIVVVHNQGCDPDDCLPGVKDDIDSCPNNGGTPPNLPPRNPANN